MSPTRGRILWVLVLALGAASPVRGSVLTFEGVPLTPAAIPDAYGDRITATTDGAGYSYGMGNGFTPNVVVEYVTNDAPLQVLYHGYGDLFYALAGNYTPVELILRPDPGYLVVLN